MVQIKVYTPLGQLTLTCSSPPNIVLNFHFQASPSAGLSVQADCADIETGSDRGESNDAKGMSRPATQHIRLVFSRISAQMTIDTVQRHSGTGSRYRTNRTVPVLPTASVESGDGTAAPVQGGAADRLRQDRTGLASDVAGERSCAGQTDAVQALERLLDSDEVGSWDTGEVEATRRLLRLREHWCDR
jgi:hypothetical protein